MSEPKTPERDLLERLSWLRLMGVDEIVRRRPDPGATPAPVKVTVRTGPEPIATPLSQANLFADSGGTGEVTPRRRARRRAAEDGMSASPLATAKAPDAANAASALAVIREELGDCRRCRLCEKRTNIVFGVGSPEASVMFIGEGPGADEDRQGEPFVGRAGQLLTKIIESMGFRRADVYIANIVKCRPPENRTPLPDEVATCSPFLFQQAAAIRPRVIVCLGTPAAQAVLATRETITRLRGTFREINGIQVMPTFHPAYLLRNPAAKREVWGDMKQVMTLLKSEG